MGKLNEGNGSGECPLKVGTASNLARLVDARLKLGLRTFLNGRVGMGGCNWFARGVSSSSSFRLLWLDSISVGTAVDGALGSLLLVCWPVW